MPTSRHVRCSRSLRELVDKGGSDLHLKVGSAPIFRVNGELTLEAGAGTLSAEETEAAMRQLLDDPAKLEEFAMEHEVDFSYEIENVARYRINAFQQRGVISLVCRAIPIASVRSKSSPPRGGARTRRGGARDRASDRYDRLG